MNEAVTGNKRIEGEKTWRVRPSWMTTLQGEVSLAVYGPMASRVGVRGVGGGGVYAV